MKRSSPVGRKGFVLLQKIAELFPKEEQRNERLRNLCQLANWWPAAPGDAERKGGTSASSRPDNSAGNASVNMGGRAGNIALTFDRDPGDIRLEATNTGAMQPIGVRYDARSTRFERPAASGCSRADAAGCMTGSMSQEPDHRPESNDLRVRATLGV